MRIRGPLALALRLSIYEGALFAVYWNIVAGVIINGLALALGARPLHLAILNGLPLLSQVFALPAAKLVQSRDIRKPFVLLTIGVSRMLWILVPLVVFFPPDTPIRIWFVLLIAAVSHIMHSSGVVGWLSWVSDLVPEQIRGVYFGARSAIAGLVGLIGLTVASAYADGVRAAVGEGEEYLHALLILVAISVAFAAGSWLGLYYQPVRKMRNLVMTGWDAIWRTLWSPNGIRIATAWAALAFATGITTGIYMPFMLDRLHMSMIDITVYGWIALSVSTILLPIWGRLSDRWGYKKVLVIGWLGTFWQPLLFVFTTQDTPQVLGVMPWPVFADAIVGGAFWPALVLSQTNLVIAEAPSQTRAGLFATLAAIAGLLGFFGAFTGGMAAEIIGEGNAFRLWALNLDDLRLPLLFGSTLRLLAGFFILTIREPSRSRHGVTGSQAFGAVWRMLIGKPYRPIR